MRKLRKGTRAMQAWHRKLLRKCLGESGATFVEYALLTALIAIAVTVAVVAFRNQLGDFFDEITGKVKDATDDTAGQTPDY
ncbi:MAG: Flp family type IVb pilin [Candidatus Pacebacteria bacterium]|nr:Flp family type IVb pilin [Candidatus Paceibacterota bacterium]